MRFVVYGAGAIGGVLGGRLFEHGHDVVLIARGAHRDAMVERGLTLASPDREVTLRVPVAGGPGEVAFGEGDVVVLAMKSQHTADALDELARVAATSTPIVCAQNGVENERAALRRFQCVYGMCVMCPAAHLEPGRVEASSTPVTGLMDLGRWPAGRDDIAEEIAAALTASSFASVARDDISRWKWGKLLMNLGNAVEAVCGGDERAPGLAKTAKAEGIACLEAAGIAFVGEAEDATRRGGLLTPRPIGDRRRQGGSTWQSLTRRAGSVETDYLSGEIVLLGRLHGFSTPLNARLQTLANEMARAHEPPGSRTVGEVLSGVA